ncbi:uncharacterized protein LOC131362442 [Hemibagrus wyckioides]|uniref:uncharacterized protein LOC131362442 n=1 Tax=Hemibagrus wyckioides TaxID=337641 RepID=UPI00266D32E6|nr:uncharacterized protein LOC131362442 [Hemibagrus wyckioides]
MTHGQAAQRPDANRISECVALKLLKEYREARNRPKDNKGKTFPIPQPIIMTYSHIKQLVEDRKELLDRTNLVLVTINNTTVSFWLLDRQKKTDWDTLLQGVDLPQQISVAKDLLPKPRGLPSTPVQHGHAVIEFQEPENLEGEAVICRCKHARTETAVSQTQAAGEPFWPGVQQDPEWFNWPGFSDQQGHYPSVTAPLSQGWSSFPPAHRPSAPTPHSQGWSSFPPAHRPSGPTPHSQEWSSFPPAQHPSAPTPQTQGWSSFLPGPQPSAPEPQTQGWSSFLPGLQPSAPVPQSQNRQRAWRLRKAEQEHQEHVARGEPPRKRHPKEGYEYKCKICGQSKNKLTGHTQVKGKWYCPASGKTIEQWKASL